MGKSSGAGKGLALLKNTIENHGQKVSDSAASLTERIPRSNAQTIVQNTRDAVQDTVVAATPNMMDKVLEKGTADDDGNEKQDVKRLTAHTTRTRPSEGIDRNWQWYALVCFGALCAIVSAWQLLVRGKRRDRRSPTLLLESEATMIMA